MHIKVAEKPVRQNIKLIQKILRRVKENSAGSPLSSEKIFKAWINRKTGQFLFSETLDKSQFTGKRDWKPVELSYQHNPQTGEIYFLLEEIEVKQRGFYSDDVTPEAFLVIQGTLVLINDLCQRVKELNNLDAKISALAKVVIEAMKSSQNETILAEAWHFVDRMGAESLLLSRPIGTYLFRKDFYAEILEQQLKGQHGNIVYCITLTYSEPNQKVTDLTLVDNNGSWGIYNDDPCLMQVMYPELQELLGQLKEQLKYPLYS